MQYIRFRYNIKIQHALQDGEYKIPETNFRVDGFHHESNTIYEFYDDRFHGNLTIFAHETKCHPYDRNVTAKELWDNTITRELKLKNKGYNLIIIWENEWDNIKGNK